MEYLPRNWRGKINVFGTEMEALILDKPAKKKSKSKKRNPVNNNPDIQTKTNKATSKKNKNTKNRSSKRTSKTKNSLDFFQMIKNFYESVQNFISSLTNQQKQNINYLCISFLLLSVFKLLFTKITSSNSYSQALSNAEITIRLLDDESSIGSYKKVKHLKKINHHNADKNTRYSRGARFQLFWLFFDDKIKN